MLQRSQYEVAYTLQRDVGNLAYALVWWMQYFGGTIRVSEGLRSAARQRELYAQGRTAPGAIVTDTLASRHVTGRAFDIDFVGVHPDAVHINGWLTAGWIGEQLGLRWGGRWAMRDYRHFEG